MELVVNNGSILRDDTRKKLKTLKHQKTPIDKINSFLIAGSKTLEIALNQKRKNFSSHSFQTLLSSRYYLYQAKNLTDLELDLRYNPESELDKKVDYSLFRLYYHMGFYELCSDIIDNQFYKYGSFEYNNITDPIADSVYKTLRNPKVNMRKALKAMNNFPGCWEAYSNLGHAYSILGNIPKAIEAYKKAISLNPKFGLPAFKLGMLYYNLGNKPNQKKAEKLFLDAVEKKYEHPELFIKLGNLCYQEKEYASAIEYYERSEVLDGSSIEPSINMFNIYMKLGDYTEAKAQLFKAGTINPECPEFLEAGKVYENYENNLNKFEE